MADRENDRVQSSAWRARCSRSGITFSGQPISTSTGRDWSTSPRCGGQLGDGHGKSAPEVRPPGRRLRARSGRKRAAALVQRRSLRSGRIRRASLHHGGLPGDIYVGEVTWTYGLPRGYDPEAVTPSRSSPGAELSAISHSHLAPCAAFSSGVIPRNEGSRRQDVMIERPSAPLALAVENTDRLGEQCPNAPSGSTS